MEIFCKKCGSFKPMEEFYCEKRRRKRKAVCRQCWPRRSTTRTPAQRAAYERLRGRTAVQYVPRQVRADAAARKRAAHLAARAAAAPKKLLAGTKEWYSSATPTDIEVYRAKKRSQFRARYKRRSADERARSQLYKHSNPEKIVKWGGRRTALIVHTDDGTLTRDIVGRLFAEAVICPYCLRSFGSRAKSLDHVTPLSKGGHHTVGNVLICCRPCNLSKGARTLLAWLPALQAG